MSEPSVVDEPNRSRYELRLGDDVVGHVEYQRHGGVIDLVHTEIAEGHAGEGLGGRLAAGVLDDVRRRGLQVTPTCEFIAGWIQKHPDYQDLVA